MLSAYLVAPHHNALHVRIYFSAYFSAMQCNPYKAAGIGVHLTFPLPAVKACSMSLHLSPPSFILIWPCASFFCSAFPGSSSQLRWHRYANLGQTSILLSNSRVHHTDFIPAQYFLPRFSPDAGCSAGDGNVLFVV